MRFKRNYTTPLGGQKCMQLNLKNVDFPIPHEYECIDCLKNQTYIMVTIVWKVLLVAYVAKRSRWSAQQGKPLIHH